MKEVRVVMKIITVMNQKGGVGKTTTAASIGSVLLEKDYKVLMLDLDPQRNLTHYYGLKDSEIEESANDLFDTKVVVDGKDIVYESSLGDIIPSHKDLATAEVRVYADLKRSTRVKEALKSLEKDYDFVVIDTPPALGVLSVNALAASDYAVIVTEAAEFPLEGIVQINDTIDVVKEVANPKLKVAGVLITKYFKNTVAQQSMAENIEIIAKNFGWGVFKNKIRHTIAVVESQMEAQSLNNYARYSDVNYDYQHFVEELLEIISREEK